MATRVILLPGGVLPAAPAYADLLLALGDDVEAVAKDLELYAGDRPPEDYTLDAEVAGVLREADARGWDAAHLVGYSAGGAAALACAAKAPERLLSLALLEPAWAGSWGWSPAHARVRAAYDALEGLPPEEFLPAFMRLGVREGVNLPPPPEGEPPPWLAARPAGIAALTRTFGSYDLDRDALRAFDKPVYLALGGLSSPDDYGETVRRLSRVFPAARLEVYPSCHHFDPPHRKEPERLAAALLRLWARA